MRCFHTTVGENNFLVQFEDGQKRKVGTFFILCIFSKEEVCLNMKEPISDLPQKTKR